MACGLDQRERGQEGCRQGPLRGLHSSSSPELMESQGGFMDIAEAELQGLGRLAPRFLVWEVGAHGGAVYRGGTLRKRCDQVREEKLLHWGCACDSGLHRPSC